MLRVLSITWAGDLSVQRSHSWKIPIDKIGFATKATWHGREWESSHRLTVDPSLRSKSATSGAFLKGGNDSATDKRITSSSISYRFSRTKGQNYISGYALSISSSAFAVPSRRRRFRAASIHGAVHHSETSISIPLTQSPVVRLVHMAWACTVLSPSGIGTIGRCLSRGALRIPYFMLTHGVLYRRSVFNRYLAPIRKSST